MLSISTGGISKANYNTTYLISHLKQHWKAKIQHGVRAQEISVLRLSKKCSKKKEGIVYICVQCRGCGAAAAATL